MGRQFRDIVIIFSCLLFLGSTAFSAESNISTTSSTDVKAAIITCSGDIDYGLYQSIKRRTNYAVAQGVQYLILEIGTYGGLLESADDISKYLILDIPRLKNDLHTVAFITTEAISAGAMISVSCKDIIMLENTTIGDCAPISLTGQLEGVEREKVESFTRAAFSRAAQANGYPEALLKAMVTMQTEVYRVRNLNTGQYEYFEGEKLPDNTEEYDLENKEQIDNPDQLLTLTAAQAYEYGIARAVVNDVNEAVDFLAERDGVTFASEPLRLDTMWSEEMVRWLNSSAVMAVLVMLALLGVYIEFNTPGLGLPGLVAVICFVIIVFSKYLDGLANWVEIAVFITGLILILVEFLILPGFGIAGILGITFLVAGLFGMLMKNPPDEFPWPSNTFEWGDFNQGIITLAIGAGGFVFCAWLLSKYMHKIPFLSGIILVPDSTKITGRMPVSITKPSESQIENLSIGDAGEATSTLRPAGKAKFGDAIVDVVATGDFINKGTKVEITEIHGNRVVVKAV